MVTPGLGGVIPEDGVVGENPGKKDTSQDTNPKMDELQGGTRVDGKST